MLDVLRKSPILVTGAAGFIGFHTVKALIDQGAENVIGIDNINDYYDQNLKIARLKHLESYSNFFKFEKIDISDFEALEQVFKKYSPTRIIHLAAQAGVRYSLSNPQAYTKSNLIGFMNMLESARLNSVEHMVYASSSSVYGANKKHPYSTTDRTDHPISLYAATKKSNECLAFSYSSMYQLPLTGLRFFTVYGPYGRPDMAYFKFTKSLYEGKAIEVYNNGNMMRDFTYIDDIVDGVIKSLLKLPESEVIGDYKIPHKLYNIGNNNPERLGIFIEILEKLTGRVAKKDFKPIQTGDVLSTYADIQDLHDAVGFTPKVKLEQGLSHFIDWYKDFYKVN